MPPIFNAHFIAFVFVAVTSPLRDLSRVCDQKACQQRRENKPGVEVCCRLAEPRARNSTVAPPGQGRRWVLLNLEHRWPPHPDLERRHTRIWSNATTASGSGDLSRATSPLRDLSRATSLLRDLSRATSPLRDLSRVNTCNTSEEILNIVAAFSMKQETQLMGWDPPTKNTNTNAIERVDC
ncbi:hypothetical protein GUJ93_ZPchr0010g9299 [Zizania palustris]|uniref:Uncharacterized protein n=1 Tax=Zizania palustris TaxID=103762 RepID=A0A8J6BGF5_ZIZPA|nr:hypothetical protein GUJ93_ZPchr0010g9299 [Zizania palustris]